MSYTTIDNPELFFQTILWTGNGSSSRSITLDGSEDMQPDWTWIKSRTGSESTQQHYLYDSVRGATKYLQSSTNNAEGTKSNGLSAFASDGFTVGDDNANNASSTTYTSWNWSASGSAPAITYSVKVVSDSGNKYRFDDFGTSAVTLDLQEGGTYTFDQSDSSNSGHPLRFYTASDKSGGEYTTGVTTTGTAGSSGAKTVITVAASAPTLYYQCSNHAGMGGQANTNSTFGSSNFGGSIQSTVSVNTTAGFSIVNYTGTGSNATVGHGLGVPKIIIVKNRDGGTDNWAVYHEELGANNWLKLNTNDASATDTVMWNNTSPTSSVFSVGTYTNSNGNSNGMLAYCFADVKGYSKFGKYTGNGNADGTYVHLGFRPAWIMIKRSDSSGHWFIHDNKRVTFNVDNKYLAADDASAEQTFTALDMLSNGFKLRSTGVGYNTSSGTFTYYAFAESPFVNSNGVPNNAR